LRRACGLSGRDRREPVGVLERPAGVDVVLSPRRWSPQQVEPNGDREQDRDRAEHEQLEGHPLALEPGR
jgi:hypothetical protein